MVEIHFKTFSPLAAPSSPVVITAQSAPTEVVRSQVVRRGAVIRGGLSVQRSACHSSPQAAGSAGEWPATTAAPAKAGASTQLLSLCAHLFRPVRHRLFRLALRRRHVPSRPHHPARTLLRRLLRCLARARDERRGRIVGRLCHSRKHSGFTAMLYNNSLTSDFSSFNSATDASIFARLKSFIGRPCTISHFSPRTRTGNDEINPFSTP